MKYQQSVRQTKMWVHCSPIVVEHGWDVLSRKSVGSVGDEQAGFTYGSIAYDNALNVLHGPCDCIGLLVVTSYDRL